MILKHMKMIIGQIYIMKEESTHEGSWKINLEL